MLQDKSGIKMGRNMKIVEDYAQRVAKQKADEKVEEKNKKLAIKLNKKRI